MKTQIAILSLSPWKFTPKGQVQERSGFSAIFLIEGYEYHKITVKDEVLSAIQKSKLPAIFEVDLKPENKRNQDDNGKVTYKLTYQLNSVKFLNEIKVF